VREREIAVRDERRRAIGGQLQPEPAGLDVHRSRSTSGPNLASSRPPGVMPVAAEMLVAIVALVG